MTARSARSRRPATFVALLRAAGIFAARGSASISDLQRPLGLSYLATADVVQVLETVGLVGPSPRRPGGRRPFMGLRGVATRLRGCIRRCE